MDAPKLQDALVIGGCGCLGHHIVKQLVADHDTSNITLRIQANTRPLYHNVNITGTKNLISSITQVGTVKALVYTSSSSVIHDNATNILNATEDLPICFEPEQLEYHTHTKAVNKELVLNANGRSGLSTAVIHAPVLFSEGDMTCTPRMVENARSGRGRFQIDDGKNLYDITPEEVNINGEAFIITNDEPWLFWDSARSTGKEAGFGKKGDFWVTLVAVYYVFAILAEWLVWLGSLGRKESDINARMGKYLTMTRTFDISKSKKRLGAVKAYLASCADGKKIA
ncbi:hypothetical protein B0J14DRAFT_615806 [Halenospora varia]|nr:hypothetical protein B0J14DRAFT_615806 [Halenospora varia]